MKLGISVLEVHLAVCQLPADSLIPEWAVGDPWFTVSRTEDELSVVCSVASVPSGIVVEKGWRLMKVEGVLDFSLVGILAEISGKLAEAGISIFVISTFNTDYILVKADVLDNAINVLRKAGFEMT